MKAIDFIILCMELECLHQGVLHSKEISKQDFHAAKVH